MNQVPAYRFCISEALRHKRRFLAERAKHIPLACRWVALADAAFHACYLDFYGVHKAEVVVFGEDHLMNLVVGFVLGSAGQRVLIVDDQLNGDPAIAQRFDLRYPGMEEILCGALGVELQDGGLEKTLAQLCQGFLDDQGQCLVRQLEASNLVHEGDSDELSFWAEPAQAPHTPLGLQPLRFWGKDELGIFGTEIGKCPQYRAVFNSIILTSASQYSRLKGTKHTALRLGDAFKPLACFDYFRASERLRELLDAIRILKHGQDFSAANQHHA